MTHMTPAQAAQQSNRTADGRYAEGSHADPGGTVLADVPAAELVPPNHVFPGDTVWIDHMPVQVQSCEWTSREATLVTGDGRTHRFDLTTRPTLYRSEEPIVDDWAEREPEDRSDLDTTGDPGETMPFANVAVTYNSQGFGRVEAAVLNAGDYAWHVGRFFDYDEDSAGDDEVQVFEPADIDTGRGPGGATLADCYVAKRELLETWMQNVGYDAIDAGIRERYGVDTGDAEFDPEPVFYAVATRPGPLSDEEICTLIHDRTVRYRNEADPGTYGAEYPWAGWLQEAVRRHGHPFESVNPA